MVSTADPRPRDPDGPNDPASNVTDNFSVAAPPMVEEDEDLEEGEEADEPEVSDELLMAMARSAVTHAEMHDIGKKKSAMVRNHQGYNNIHAQGSKYLAREFSSRSKLHVPKTRAAVKKNMVSGANALFSTDDVVSVNAEDDSDPNQLASAQLLKQLLKYRLDRSNHRAGVPWFVISMAMLQDCRIDGVCFSKQFWEFEEVTDTIDVDDPGSPVIDMNGMPVKRTKKRRTLRDRPMIEPHPAENAVIDMAAPFYDVVQGGAFFIMKIPMHIGDVRTMMKPGRQKAGGGGWFNIPDKVLRHAAQDSAAMAVRSARSQGQDRYGRDSQPPINDYDIVWVHENFIRVSGRDFHFWSLGTKQLLSESKETIDAYPKHHGERPYVMGLGDIEAHNPLPMSAVEALRPLQDEINDLRNLTLDTVKQTISPVAIVRRGRSVDLRQVRQRGPDALIVASDIEKDIRFDRGGELSPMAFTQADRLNVEFDELAGGFSTSAVQSNRNLNETVGGMQLMNNAASGVQEFDLRVFIETWAEPVLRHLVWLEQGYESDDKLLALSAKRAKLWDSFDNAQAERPDVYSLLEQQVTIRVNVGIGAADPIQRMAKLEKALAMALMAGKSGVLQGQIVGKAEALFDEFFGLAGYNQAARFFTFTPPEEAAAKIPPPPEVAKAENDKGRLQLDGAAKQKELELAEREVVIKEQQAQVEQRLKAMEMAMGERDRQLSHFGEKRQIEADEQDRNFQRETATEDRNFQREDRQFERQERQQDRAAGERGEHREMVGQAHQMMGADRAAKAKLQPAVPAGRGGRESPAAQPPAAAAPDPSAIVAPMMQAMQRLEMRLQAMAKEDVAQSNHLTEMVAQIAAQIGAPVSISGYDESGRATSVRKGSIEYQVTRDGQGRPSGLTPAAQGEQ